MKPKTFINRLGVVNFFQPSLIVGDELFKLGYPAGVHAFLCGGKINGPEISYELVHCFVRFRKVLF